MILHSTVSQRCSESRKRRPARRPSLEVLEDRTLLDIQLPNVLVNDPKEDGRSSHDTQSETTLVVGANHTVVVAYNDSLLGSMNPFQFTGYSQSTDSGASFVDKGALPPNPNGDASDPVLAADNVSGRIYLSTLSVSVGVIDVFRSDDNGASFKAPVNGAPSASALWDKDWLTVDNYPGPGQGNVYLVARDFGPGNGIFLFRSTDGGDTWTPNGGTLIVSAGQTNVTGAWVTVGPDHAVYVAWFDERTATGRILIKKSTDGGLTFGAEKLVTTLRTTNPDGDLNLGAFRSNSFPQVVVNPATGALYVVYNDKGTASADRADIFFRQSTDGGATWSRAVKVNDDTTTRDQWQPALAVSPSGHKIGIFWYDRRNDPANNLIDRYGAIGTVDGDTVTFAPNFRVTDEAFPPVIGTDPIVSPSYMGDYDQAVATRSHFYLTWGDNRLKSLGHKGNNADVRFASVAAEVAGPSVLATTPSHDTYGDVNHMRIAFDEAIDVSTFTLDKIVSFTGPDGPIAVTGITLVPNTMNQFDITFASQHSLGDYTMVLGPDIRDIDGHPMDQNDNGTPGEADDQYRAKFTIQGPKIIASTPGDKVFGPVSSIRVTFNEPVDLATFTVQSIASFSGPNGSIGIASVTPTAGSDNTQFDIGFAPQFITGGYTMVIGPDIRDLAGHQMDQDGNFVEGEFPGDAFAAQFDIRGPAILSTTPNTTVGPVFSLRVTFDEPMDASTFTVDDVASFTGPNGPTSVVGVAPVAGSKLTQFDISFAPQTTTGRYAMVIGPNIRDVLGNPMDQNDNLITGETPDDQYTAKFSVTGPKIIGSTPSVLAIGSLDHVRVTFREPMDASTFTPDKIALFTGPQGAIPVTSVSVVPFTGNTQFDINFQPSSVVGSYTLVIGPDIRDIYGNAMDQNDNFVPGEVPGDQFTLQFALYSVDLMNNGDFEANGGSLDGWTTMSQANSSGDWYIQTGTTSPLSGFFVPEPPGPTHAAMTDMFGPGTHILYQDFTVPSGLTAALLSFDRFIGNQAGLFITPATLDFTSVANQQARVDIITTTANPFSVATSDVLLKIYQTEVGDPPISGYTTQTTDLTDFLMAHQGQTLRLRFAMADNQFFFQFGVDRVILALNGGAGGAAASHRGKVSRARVASASAAFVPGVAPALSSRYAEAAFPFHAIPLPNPPLMSIPSPVAQPTGMVLARGNGREIDRLFNFIGKDNADHVFTVGRFDPVESALAGQWPDDAVTTLFGKGSLSS
jgi:hypothetical protein